MHGRTAQRSKSTTAVLPPLITTPTRSFALGGAWNQLFWFSDDSARLITSTEYREEENLEVFIRSWPIEGGGPDLLARLEAPRDSGGSFFGVDPTESVVAWVDGSTFNIAPLQSKEVGSARSVLLEHDRNITMAVFDDGGRQLATADEGEAIRVWSLDHDPPALIRSVAGVGTQFPWSLRFDSTGSMLGSARGFVCDITAPPQTEALRLERPFGRYGVAFHPDGR